MTHARVAERFLSRRNVASERQGSRAQAEYFSKEYALLHSNPPKMVSNGKGYSWLMMYSTALSKYVGIVALGSDDEGQDLLRETLKNHKLALRILNDLATEYQMPPDMRRPL